MDILVHQCLVHVLWLDPFYYFYYLAVLLVHQGLYGLMELLRIPAQFSVLDSLFEVGFGFDVTFRWDVVGSNLLHTEVLLSDIKLLFDLGFRWCDLKVIGRSIIK